MKKIKNTIVPDSVDLFDQIVDLLCDAVRLAAGEAYAIFLRSRQGCVRVGTHWATSADFQSSCAKDIFFRAGSIISIPTKPLAYNPLNLSSTSALGLKRMFTYNNPNELAQNIINFMPEEARCLLLASTVVSGKEGAIMIVTKQHLSWHLSHDRIPCHICCHFSKGIRGLRMHQILHHGVLYEKAQGEATESKQWLVLFTPLACGPSDMRTKAGEELMKQETCRADPGLEAAKRGELSVLRRLVASGWDPIETVDRNGSTAFMWAAGEGHVDVCRYLVDQCKVEVNQLRGKEKMKRHALHWACRNGKLRVARWLVLEKHVDPDVGTEDGTTSLHFAAYNGQIETCSWLVEYCHCDVNILNTYGCNASQWWYVVHSIVNSTKAVSKDFDFSALRGDVDMMRFFKSVGLDFSILNSNGHSALHKAAIKGHISACLWLLQEIELGGAGLGREHMLPDSDGFTPMRFATANDHVELGRILTEYFERVSSCSTLGSDC